MFSTSQPSCRTRCLHTAEPMNPAPPVTITRMYPRVSVEINRQLTQSRMHPITVRQVSGALLYWPIDPQIRVVPQQTTVVFARVVVGDLRQPRYWVQACRTRARSRWERG